LQQKHKQRQRLSFTEKIEYNMSGTNDDTREETNPQDEAEEEQSNNNINSTSGPFIVETVGEDSDSDEDDDDDEEDFMDVLPASVRARVETLKEMNAQRDTIMDEYLKERAVLEKKYADLCKPLFAQRAEVICGKKDEEIAAAAPPADSEEGGDDGAEAEKLVGVPEFWTCAISNIEAISELVTEPDQDCLLHLENITCDDFDDGKGFDLKFHFKEDNPYFTNTVLTKRYEIPNLFLDDEPILKNVEGCDIKWKANKCLTFKEVTKKQRSKAGKKAGQIRTIKKKERTDSFFHFFSPPKIPNIGDMDEEEADAIEEAFDHDYDVAQSFRSHIIPKAVMWFTGEAMQDEFERMMDDGTTSQLMAQVEARANAVAAAAAGGNGSPFPAAANGTEEPECKQS
jgi:nucleosome assembly protein 1-like 1